MSVTINTTVTKEELLFLCFLRHAHSTGNKSRYHHDPEEMFPLSPFMFIGKSECGFRTDFTTLLLVFFFLFSAMSYGRWTSRH